VQQKLSFLALLPFCNRTKIQHLLETILCFPEEGIYLKGCRFGESQRAETGGGGC
jgi:hypothetical protein